MNLYFAQNSINFFYWHWITWFVRSWMSFSMGGNLCCLKRKCDSVGNFDEVRWEDTTLWRSNKYSKNLYLAFSLIYFRGLALSGVAVTTLSLSHYSTPLNVWEFLWIFIKLILNPNVYISNNRDFML